MGLAFAAAAGLTNRGVQRGHPAFTCLPEQARLHTWTPAPLDFTGARKPNHDYGRTQLRLRVE